MPTPPSNRSHGPLSEEVMVDWIDGVLTESEIARLEAASGRPDIAQTIARLRRNRELLAALPEVPAPEGLHDRVMATLERDSLLGVSAEQWAAVEESAAPLATAPQASLPLNGLGTKATRKPGPIDPLIDDRNSSGAQRSRRVAPSRWWRAAPSLAMAASILLILGGGVLLAPAIRRAFISPVYPNGPATPEIATNDGAPNLVTPDADAATTSDSNNAVEIASTNPAASTDSTQPSVAERRVITDANKALALASEGRLLVRLLTRSSDKLERVELTATNPQSRLPWRLSRDVPPAAVAMMLPPQKAQPAFASASPRDRATMLVASLSGPGAALSMPDPTRWSPTSTVHGTYALDVAQTSQGFSQAIDMLSKGLSASVQFEDVGEPIRLDLEPQTRDVLWWQQPPSQWTPRVVVPLIVQRG